MKEGDAILVLLAAANRDPLANRDPERFAILYRLLWQRDCDPVAYNENLALGRRSTMHWDDPELKKPTNKGSRPK